MDKNQMTQVIVRGSNGVETVAPVNDMQEARRVMAIQNAANITRTLASNRASFYVDYAPKAITFFVAHHEAKELRNLLTGFVDGEFSFIRNSDILAAAEITLTW